LDINAPAFTPGQNPELKKDFLEPDEVVDIITKDCRSTDKNDKAKRTKNENARTIVDEVVPKVHSQRAVSRETVEIFNETNARGEANLRKFSEVKTDRKRVISKDREDRIKNQAVVKEEK
jgi:hypothetical protein